jgi:aerobic C4-dicarboxylate transport protein
LTPANLVGNAVATIAMAKWEGALDEKQLHRVLNGGPAKVSSAD